MKELKEVLSGAGVPTASQFAKADGTPLYLDLTTGIAYFCTTTGVVTALVSAAAIALTSLTPSIDETVTALRSAYVCEYYEIASGMFLEIGDGAVMEVG